MNVRDLLPKEVYRYFCDISSIPHGSGNTDKIVEYLLDFAKEHSLKAFNDESNNVYIYSEGTRGFENHEPVILQGHIDMVCEKTSDCIIDMEKEGLNLCTDGNKVWAMKTTLGADDGIAVAYILAILADNNISHPPIEALLTSDEEIGLLGARNIHPEKLKAKRLINIDSEEEGVLFVSCAGGVRCSCTIPVELTETTKDMCFYRISVDGLMGGHSGIEIHKHRENSIKLLGNVLGCINRSCDISIVKISGGGKDNAIPKKAEAYVGVKEKDKHTLEFSIKEYLKLMHQELAATEPELVIAFSQSQEFEECMTKESSKKIIFALQHVPNGLYKMSPEIEGMVQTSLNMGTCDTDKENVSLSFMIRSNNYSGKQIIREKLETFFDYIGGTVVFSSDYPAWEYRVKSELRDICVKSFKEVYNKAPRVTSIHAGLECAIIAEKINDLDMISFGPTLVNVHTPDEYMDVASVKRTWEYLLNILKNM